MNDFALSLTYFSVSSDMIKLSLTRSWHSYHLLNRETLLGYWYISYISHCRFETDHYQFLSLISFLWELERL